MMTEPTDKPKEQHVDPWTAVAAEGENKIDYDKLISALSDLCKTIKHVLLSWFLQNSLVANA